MLIKLHGDFVTLCVLTGALHPMLHFCALFQCINGAPMTCQSSYFSGSFEKPTAFYISAEHSALQFAFTFQSVSIGQTCIGSVVGMCDVCSWDNDACGTVFL